MENWEQFTHLAEFSFWVPKIFILCTLNSFTHRNKLKSYQKVVEKHAYVVLMQDLQYSVDII